MSLNNPKINQLFSNLRKQGFIARQNYLCCGNCAGSQIASDIEKMKADKPEKYAKLQGAIFFHRQDTASAESDGELYLRYSCVNNEDPTKPDTKWVGSMIVFALIDAGIEFEWNGNPNSCIIAKLTW